MPNLVKELRFNNIELRTESVDSKLVVEGYAIVWNAQTLIGDEEYGYYEEVEVKDYDQILVLYFPQKSCAYVLHRLF